MDTLKCPVCGSTDVDSEREPGEFELGFGESAKLDVIVNKCRVCQESGDFLAANDGPIEAAIAAAEDRLVGKNIDSLAAYGHTMASCERALGLAPRTMARWKSGHISDSAKVLLKILRTFPWILEVARSQFSRSVADAHLRQQAGYVRASTFSALSAIHPSLETSTRAQKNSFEIRT